LTGPPDGKRISGWLSWKFNKYNDGFRPLMAAVKNAEVVNTDIDWITFPEK